MKRRQKITRRRRRRRKGWLHIHSVLWGGKSRGVKDRGFWGCVLCSSTVQIPPFPSLKMSSWSIQSSPTRYPPQRSREGAYLAQTHELHLGAISFVVFCQSLLDCGVFRILLESLLHFVYIHVDARSVRCEFTPTWILGLMFTRSGLLFVCLIESSCRIRAAWGIVGGNPCFVCNWA